MKRVILLPIIVALLVFSCNKKEGSRTGGEVPDGANEGFSAADTGSGRGSGWKDGFVLRVGAAFYTLATDTGEESDKTVWNASMDLGERVLVGEKRRVTFHGNGKVDNFVEVQLENGTKGVAWDVHIADGGRLAVIIDETANLFRSPKTLDATSNSLPRKTVVALFPETERDGYVEIKAYDPVKSVGRQNYVRMSTLSQRDADIQSSILLQTAESLTQESQKVRREVLLNSALTDYSNSAFIGDIRALATPNTAAVIPTEPAEYTNMYVNDTNVNIRDIPDTIAGKVVGQLNTGDAVTVDLQTVNTTTINGHSDRWYHITNPMVGWVFGQFIVPAN